jgi:hypothetical protein
VTEHAAAIAQQMAVHGALLVVVVILGSRGFRHPDSQYAGVSGWAIGRRFGCSIIERFLRTTEWFEQRLHLPKKCPTGQKNQTKKIPTYDSLQKQKKPVSVETETGFSHLNGRYFRSSKWSRRNS